MPNHQGMEIERTAKLLHSLSRLSDPHGGRNWDTVDQRQWRKDARNVIAVINGTPIRQRTCLDCGTIWHQIVELSEYTANLSGEKSVRCPSCESRSVMSGPQE